MNQYEAMSFMAAILTIGVIVIAVGTDLFSDLIAGVSVKRLSDPAPKDIFDEARERQRREMSAAHAKPLSAGQLTNMQTANYRSSGMSSYNITPNGAAT